MTFRRHFSFLLVYQKTQCTFAEIYCSFCLCNPLPIIFTSKHWRTHLKTNWFYDRVSKEKRYPFGAFFFSWLKLIKQCCNNKLIVIERFSKRFFKKDSWPEFSPSLQNNAFHLLFRSWDQFSLTPAGEKNAKFDISEEIELQIISSDSVWLPFLVSVSYWPDPLHALLWLVDDGHHPLRLWCSHCQKSGRYTPFGNCKQIS